MEHGGRRLRARPHEDLDAVVEEQQRVRRGLLARERERLRQADAAARDGPPRARVEVLAEAVERRVGEAAQRGEGHREHAVDEGGPLVGGDARLARRRVAPVEDGLLEAKAQERQRLP